MKRLTFRGLLALTLAVGLVAAACSDDDDNGSDNGAAPERECTEEATGEVAKIVSIYDESEAAGISFQTARAGMDAKVEAINCSGGLGGSGRPVEVETCSSELDPNRTAQCARDAVADESVVAIVGSVVGNDVVNPILEEAGMANVGQTAFGLSDGTSTSSFPVMGGLIAATGGQASILADEAGSTEIGVAYSDTPGADGSVLLVEQVLAPRDLTVADTVVVPVAKPDLSAEVSALLSASDAIVTASDGETAKKVIRTARQQGSDAPISGSGAQQFTPDAISSLGEDVEDLYLALWFATDDMPGEGVAEYVADMEAIGALDQSDDLAKNSWIALELLDQAAAELVAAGGTIDRTTVLTTLGGMSAFDTGGLTPVLDFTTPGTLLGGAQPRIVNPTVVYAQIQDGVIVPLAEEFVNPFDVSG